MSEDALIYHAILINIIDNINDIKPKDDIVVSLGNIRDMIIQNDDLKKYPELYQHIDRNFNKLIKIVEDDRANMCLRYDHNDLNER